MDSDTNGSLSEHELHRRLSLSRFLFKQAQRVLQRPVSYSWGLATSLLQDSVEIFLRVLAAHYKIEVDRFEGFDKLLNKVGDGEGLECVGGHKAGLNRLNTARVVFKHEGLSVDARDVQGFVSNVDAFLTEVSDKVLKIDFATLSMADAIGHRRTQNWLAEAEVAHAAGLYAEAVECAAKALAVYLWHSDEADAAIQVRPTFSRYSGTFDFEPWARDNIISTRRRLDLFTRGVDVASYDRFLTLTPRLRVSFWGEIEQVGQAAADATNEVARFCIDFVVDSALALRDSRVLRPRRSTHDSNETRVRVKTCCDIVATTGPGTPEVIREAQPGEELLVVSTKSFRFRNANHEFVCVEEDGDVAFVSKNCIEGAPEP